MFNYNNIFQKLILPFSELITGINLTKEIDRVKIESSLTEIELLALQDNKLNKLMNFAIKYSPYYKNLLSGINSNSTLTIEDFPILTKEIIRNNTDLLLTTNKNNLIKNGSSGSTGVQTFVYWSKQEQTTFRAIQMLWWYWAGYQFGDKLLQTGINPNRGVLKSLKDKLFRTKYIQAFFHSEKEIIKILTKIQHKKDYVLAGYASSLYVLSRVAKQYGLKCSFRTAISWGDKLFDHYKTNINEQFGCQVFETYGSAEGFLIAAQHDLSYLYIMSPFVYLEIVDDNGNSVPDGQIGHVLVTNLEAYSMPLIRYKIGDLAIKLPKNKYPDRRLFSLPILQKVIGRDTDIIKTPSGGFMVVHSFTGIFEHISEIKQFCVIQRNLSGIEIIYIPADGFYPKVLDKIKFKLSSLINESFDIQFREVDFIPATKSGKPQLIISELS